jgi:hypothetical protein
MNFDVAKLCVDVSGINHLVDQHHCRPSGHQHRFVNTGIYNVREQNHELLDICIDVFNMKSDVPGHHCWAFEVVGGCLNDPSRALGVRC